MIHLQRPTRGSIQHPYLATDILSTIFVETYSSGGRAACITAWNCSEAFSYSEPYSKQAALQIMR